MGVYSKYLSVLSAIKFYRIPFNFSIMTTLFSTCMKNALQCKKNKKQKNPHNFSDPSIFQVFNSNVDQTTKKKFTVN